MTSRLSPYGNLENNNIPISSLKSSGFQTPIFLYWASISTFIITIFHLLRNITNLYFVFLIISTFFLLIGIFQLNYIDKKKNIFLFIIFLIFSYCCALSYYHSNDFGSPLLGISRLGFIIPAVLAIIYGINRSSFKMFIFLWTFFVLLAAISLPLQFATGPIGWFSESFERVGTARFGSLAGSLTTFGNIVGSALFVILMAYRKPQYIALAVVILTLGALASLQKAAFGSMGFALFTVLLAGRLRIGSIAGLLLAILVLGTVGIYLTDYQTQNTLILLFETFAGTVDAGRASDVSLVQSIYDRTFDLPFIAFNFFGSSALLSGVGVFGGSGSLGYPNLPHTHNLVGETILLYGLIPGTFIVIYLFTMLVRAVVILINQRGVYDQNSVIAAGLLLNVTLPTIFAGALFYHPISGTIFWVSLVYLHRYARPGLKNIKADL